MPTVGFSLSFPIDAIFSDFWKEARSRALKVSCQFSLLPIPQSKGEGTAFYFRYFPVATPRSGTAGEPQEISM